MPAGPARCYSLPMCGRFYLTAGGAEIKKKFVVDQVPELVPRYNIAPTSAFSDGGRGGEAEDSPTGSRGAACPPGRVISRWVPEWSTRLAEEIEDKPVFMSAFHAQRCFVPANGYYEWRARGARKQPFKIMLRNGALCAFAGLWERWTPEIGEPVETFAIVTTRANKLGQRGARPHAGDHCTGPIISAGSPPPTRRQSGCWPPIPAQ